MRYSVFVFLSFRHSILYYYISIAGTYLYTTTCDDVIQPKLFAHAYIDKFAICSWCCYRTSADSGVYINNTVILLYDDRRRGVINFRANSTKIIISCTRYAVIIHGTSIWQTVNANTTSRSDRTTVSTGNIH